MNPTLCPPCFYNQVQVRYTWTFKNLIELFILGWDEQLKLCKTINLLMHSTDWHIYKRGSHRLCFTGHLGMMDDYR